MIRHDPHYTYYVVVAEWTDGRRRLWSHGQRGGDEPFLTSDANSLFVPCYSLREAHGLQAAVAEHTARIGGTAAIYGVKHQTPANDAIGERKTYFLL